MSARHGTSSFLVTNAQFPQEIRSVPPVTQFYISVDGSTKEGLKKLDRPLFRDYWERFNQCVEAVKSRVWSKDTVFNGRRSERCCG